MATPNPALEAAIGHFAQQPNVSPADVSKLRAALASDPGLTTRMEAAATSGALHGFALRVQSMVVDFGGKSFVDGTHAMHPVTADMVTNLQDTMNGSPALAEELKRAATTSDPQQPQHRILENFAFTAPGDGVGGSFSASTHTMNLVSESLATSTPGSSQRYDVHDLTFVVGHEVQHGFNAQVAAQRDAKFVHDVRAMAASAGPIHDYTALVEQHIQTSREDEAKAEIAGWNALRSRVEHDNGAVTLNALEKAAPGRVNDFVESTNGQLGPRANVTLQPDLSMAQTPANVAAMGHNYFDRPVHPQAGDTRQPMGLGHNHVSDYPNRNAGWAVAVIGLEEQNAVHRLGTQPQVQINMAHAGLSEEMMEKAGLNLRPSMQSVPYLDSTTQPAVPHAFDHTSDGLHQYQYQPVAPARLDDPGHADHALFQQARGHVAALDRSLGRTPDQYTDHLFDRQTSVPTAESMTPMEHSAAKWPDAMQQFQEAQQQAQSQQATQNQAQTQGPVMTYGGH